MAPRIGCEETLSSTPRNEHRAVALTAAGMAPWNGCEAPLSSSPQHYQ
jgi:hypothetical protein